MALTNEGRYLRDQQRRDREKLDRERARWQQIGQLQRAGWSDVRTFLEDDCLVHYRVSREYTAALGRLLPKECRRRGPSVGRAYGTWNWYRCPEGEGEVRALVQLAYQEYRRVRPQPSAFLSEELPPWREALRRVFRATPAEREALRALLALTK